jgi:hypothetical protein
MYSFLLYGDDNTGIIFGAIIGLIIWLVIIYNIIASATRSRRIETLLMFQARILKEMAVKDGIPEEKIKEITDNLKKMHSEVSI